MQIISEQNKCQRAVPRMRKRAKTLSEQIDTDRLTRQIERRLGKRYLRLINGALADIDTAEKVTAAITCPPACLSAQHLIAIRSRIAD